MGNFVIAKQQKMPSLQFNLSETEIEKLRYQRFAYPDPIIQKRIYSVYLKATLGFGNSMIGKIVDLYTTQLANG